MLTPWSSLGAAATIDGMLLCGHVESRHGSREALRPAARPSRAKRVSGLAPAPDPFNAMGEMTWPIDGSLRVAFGAMKAMAQRTWKAGEPLELLELPTPEPRKHEIRVQVQA